MFDKAGEKLARASTMLAPASSRDSSSPEPGKHAKACPAKEKLPHQLASSCCRGQNTAFRRLPRIVIPENVRVPDEIDRAMAEYSGCTPEDSPTWGTQSPFSASLS